MPVVDMRLKLGNPSSEVAQETCIIVLEVDANVESIVVGALADAVCEVWISGVLRLNYRRALAPA